MTPPDRSFEAPRRWRLVGLKVAAISVLILLLTVAILWTSPTSSLRADNFSKIRPGMTRGEVEALLNGPPGDYGRYADGAVEVGDGSVLQVFAVPGAGPARSETWQDDRNRLFLFFDDRSAVVAASKASDFRRHPRVGTLARVGEALRSIFH